MGHRRPAPSGDIRAIPAPPAGWFDHEFNVLMDGSLAMLRAQRDIHGDYRAWRMAYQESGHVTPMPPDWNERLRLSAFDGRTEGPAIEPALHVAHIVQRLADGRWLVTMARAAPGEANARLFTADGEAAGSMQLGDGIAHVQCSTDGGIWVGYFDEGVYGGRQPDGARPVSASGIVRFDADGSPTWRLDDHPEAPYLADCYAMALSGETLWTCYYTDFSIVRIEAGAVRSWTNEEIAGAKALAVDGDLVLLAGGYDKDAARIALLRLGPQGAQSLGKVWLEPPTDPSRRMIGHGDTLHIIEDGQWRRITVADVHRALGY